ncbi:type VI secretion system Vgr family protein [Thetidibacter halocola]|uniref:Type VI secretion system tip protein VgrG n=1 Tax=Thetidibacter halocola TaxID=2827239 RepID=A0A8J7WB69_9RHOB|nr:type VI secretion system tip protein TssI/VgrG [Thetidibacter halocola]MBS0123537.1 type VI secretion system tip protein VgrG [Thetidibacter halocola]
MPASFKQDGRMGRFHSSLGTDVLVLLRFNGSDHLNDLFEYRVEALSTDPDLKLDDILGTHAQVELLDRKGNSVWFDGIVTRVVWAGPYENGHRYDLELRPWFWLAGRKRNQRIFHEMSVDEILQELLQPYAALGQPHLSNKLTKSYPTLEYTVQYRESDLNFACRLMERFGITYAFRHEQGNHTMLLLDDPEEHPEIPGGKRPYLGVEGHHQADEEHFWEFLPERNITTGAVRLTDYNFKTPTAAMEVDHSDPAPHEMADIESFDYPGDYLEAGDGRSRVATLRVRQERTRDKAVRALGDVVSLKSGMRIGLGGEHLASVLQETYVALAASHSYVSDSYGSGGAASDGYAYRGSYMLQPAKAPLAPVCKTPQPVVQGPQTAMVVGEGEIDCDEFGRILVRFHWDLNAAHSMRCRVSQSWASKGWGGMVIPRIGMEVVVEFLEGDPDKPLVTGCVYNGKNTPAYPLPANKTKSVFRTDSHQGSGFNELVFEDEPGKEHIAIKAQQDLSTLVLNDQVERIKRHDVQSVGVNKLVEVGKNHKTEVGGSVNITVGGTGQGASSMFSGLSGLSSKTKSLLNKGGSKGGGGGSDLGKFAGTVGKAALGFLSSKGGKGRGGLHGADEAGKDANHAMRGAGSELGDSGDDLFDQPGVMNTVVSNFRSDTTGVASSEMVGVTKVLTVGGALMEFVGMEKEVTVGQKLTTTVGESILNQTPKHTLIATQKFTIAAPGGSIEIDQSGITIKAFQLKVLCPSVDFNPGAPATAEVLKAEQAFAQECKATLGG